MVAAAMKYMASNFVKLDKFERVDFRRWQKNMHFLLSSMSVVYVLTTHIPEDGGDDSTVEQIRKRAKWDNDDYVCRGLILNSMSDSLFDIYQNVKSSKELWDFAIVRVVKISSLSMSVVYVLTTPIPEDGGGDATMEQIRKRAKWNNDDYAKYMADDASSKKFLVSNFTNYKMTHSRPVMEQYNELLDILGRFTQHTMNRDKTIQVSCIIDKLLPSWKDFKHTLKYLKEELTLVELGSHLHIEESLGMQDNDKPKGNNVAGPQHLKNDGKGGKVGNKANGSGTNGSVDGYTNSLKGWDVAWWVDSGAIVHVCKDRYLFKTYESLNNGSILHMINESTALDKREALDKFKVFKTEVELQQGSLIKRFRTDRGGEYMDTLYFRTESMVLGAIVRLSDPKLKTLGERGIECIFVGYAEHSKAFRFYFNKHNDSVSINSIIESMDVIFDENKLSSVPRLSLRIPNGTEDIGGSVVPEKVTKEDDPKTFDEAMKKLEVDGTIEKFKARLVIQGFKQKSGIDYFDTYALVARISTIRLLIAMASIHNLVIHQMDVKTAFLNGDLDEEVDLTKEFLSSRFFMKDMGEADVILGIRIKHESNRIAISQSHYIKKALKKFNYFNCTPFSTPMDTSEKLMPNNGQAVSQLEYSRVIGCLMYATTYTRHDIAFVVGKVSRYTSNPGTQHWQAIQRVLKYLKKTMDYRLTYIGYPSVLEGYTDASWISNTEENSYTSGWVFLLGGGAISWASKKQTCITGSIIESEFVALAAAGKEAEWLRNMILEIILWSKPIAPISIRYDSVATLVKAYSQMYNGKSRHLGVRHSMIRELNTNGVVSIEFMRSQQNLVDYLTKGMAIYLVIKSAKGMGLKSN
ncbi:zinc finger, CCHC-type containing protein [Tanacetum coccineum]